MWHIYPWGNRSLQIHNASDIEEITPILVSRGHTGDSFLKPCKNRSGALLTAIISIAGGLLPLKGIVQCYLRGAKSGINP